MGAPASFVSLRSRKRLKFTRHAPLIPSPSCPIYGSGKSWNSNGTSIGSLPVG